MAVIARYDCCQLLLTALWNRLVAALKLTPLTQCWHIHRWTISFLVGLLLVKTSVEAMDRYDARKKDLRQVSLSTYADIHDSHIR
jgi:hypothetical protein